MNQKYSNITVSLFKFEIHKNVDENYDLIIKKSLIANRSDIQFSHKATYSMKLMDLITTVIRNKINLTDCVYSILNSLKGWMGNKKNDG